MAPRIVIRDALAASPDGAPLAGATVVVEGRHVRHVYARGQGHLPQPGDWEIEAQGRLLLPGFVDAHAHLAVGVLLRLAALPARAPASLADLRASFRGPAEGRLDGPALEALAAAGALAALRAGTTCAFDLVRAGPGQEGAALDAVAAGVKKVGLRAALAYGANDRGGPERGLAGVEACAEFAERSLEERTLRGMAGLDGLAAVGGSTLEAAAEQAGRFGLHASVAEDDEDLAHTFASAGKRPLQLLHDVGALGAKSLVAHGATVDRSEAELLAAVGGFLAVTPRAAMLWGGALPPVESIAGRGAYVTAGTDGLFADVPGEAVAALCELRKESRDPRAARDLVGRDLFPSAARLASRLFGETVGALREGALADLALFDFRPGFPLDGLTGADLALMAAGSPAAWVLVDGEVRLREGELLGADARELAHAAQEAARRVLAG